MRQSLRQNLCSRTNLLNALDPSMDDTGILPCGEMRLLPETAREQVSTPAGIEGGQPLAESTPGLPGDLELHRPGGLLLNHGRSIANPAAGADIVDLQPHEIAAPEFAVYSEVEQGEVAGSALHLEPDPDRPHVLRLQRALLPNKAPFVLGIATRYRRSVAIEHHPATP